MSTQMGASSDRGAPREDRDQSSEPKHIIVLIHGIRTHAAWAEMVAGILSKELDVEVQPVRYGFFDTIRFISPWLTRKPAIDRIIRELRDIRAESPTANISVIAHSFGTYALTKALNELDIKLHRVLFCGSIVPDAFRRAQYRSQLGPGQILNDCGTHDVWPVLAKSVTWGYGATGTFGFGTRGIRDRYNKFGHGDYFTEEFVRDYWVPFFKSGEIKKTDWEIVRKTPPYWQSILQWLPLRWVLIAALAYALYWLISFVITRLLDVEIFWNNTKTIRYYSSHVTLSGSEEDCRSGKCKIVFRDSAFLSGPRGADMSYEGRAMTSGKITSIKTNPPHVIMNPNQWPDNPTVLMFKIPPSSNYGGRLEASGELTAEQTFTPESGKVGPHLPYDTRFAVFTLDIRELKFALRNMEPQIEIRRSDGVLVPGYSNPRITFLAGGKIIVVTAADLVAGSSIYIRWGDSMNGPKNQGRQKYD